VVAGRVAFNQRSFSTVFNKRGDKMSVTRRDLLLGAGLFFEVSKVITKGQRRLFCRSKAPATHHRYFKKLDAILAFKPRGESD
jgi:hypothetical protein